MIDEIIFFSDGFKESTDFLEALSSSATRKHSHIVKKPPVKIDKTETSQETLEANTGHTNNNIESTTSITTSLINRVNITKILLILTLKI